MSTAVDFARYNGQSTDPAPGAMEMAARRCPPSCRNTDGGTCPRCYAETGLGCPHGFLCDRCVRERAAETIARLAATPTPPRMKRIELGHRYLIRRVPNWRLSHWALARVNRWLRDSGSTWQLWARPRDPKRGKKYGRYSELPWADAKSFAVYLKQRTAWRTAR